MMGPTQRREPKLFYAGLDLEQRVPAGHALRRISRVVDFGFVRGQVRPLYGRRGNPSVDPVVLLKLMFVLYHENVRSERALLEQLPLRLDWLWFCGYDLDDTLPHHSVISKARRRWGVGTFEALFGQVLAQCVAAGLVDGGLVHVDASLIAANASWDRLQPALRRTGQTLYQTLEAEVADTAGSAAVGPPAADEWAERPGSDPEATAPPRPSTPVSPVDPDARLKSTGSQTVLGYKDHRVVDDRVGIITATITTDAATAEAQVLLALLDQHAQHIGTDVTTVVADKAYGTAENYQALQQRQVKPCIPHIRPAQPAGQFPHAAFTYDAQRDGYVCPAGQTLQPYTYEAAEQRHRYRAARGVCAACALRARCTKGQTGRVVGRHVLQRCIEWADACFSKPHRRRLMRRRKIRAEGSFADAANNHGYKRARWRRLDRVRIQNLLIAAIQNVRKLLKAAPVPGAAVAAGIAAVTAMHLTRFIAVLSRLRRLFGRPSFA